MWDLKPTAPAEVRGPFNPIATAVPGFQICEHLPLLAQRANHFAAMTCLNDAAACSRYPCWNKVTPRLKSLR